VLPDEDDGNAYQQGQDDTDPDDLKQVPNSCDQGGTILGEHFHCVNRISAGTGATDS
jgi:hypothetical protein